MASHKRLGLVAALIVHLLAIKAAADPAPSNYLRMRDPSSLTLKSGRVLDLPPGRFVEESAFAANEAEEKRLQEAETRLTAENKSLRETAATWQPGWKTLALTLATGLALGVYLEHAL